MAGWNLVPPPFFLPHKVSKATTQKPIISKNKVDFPLVGIEHAHTASLGWSWSTLPT